MSYFAPYIDETGAHIPGYHDILEYILEKYRGIYGNDIYLDDDSQDYQFLSSLALLYYDCCQTFLLAYNNQSPTTAVGAALDRLCAINGITRNISSYSLATLTLTGKPYATISYVQAKDINGYIWQLNENITFNANGSASVVASCTVPGSIDAAANTITQMATPLQDWYSVTNPLAAIPGEEVEQDSDLRERRQKSVSLQSISQLDSLYAALKALTDESGNSLIDRLAVYENDTSSVDSKGVTAHSIAVVAESSTSDSTKKAIAETIYQKKPPGTATYKVSSSTYGFAVDVESSLGITNTINYSIPEPIVATVALTIVNLGSLTDSIKENIKTNIKNYIDDLGIGESLYISNLFLPILQANPDSTSPAFYISSLTVNSQSTSVSVGSFQAMQCDVSDITITVS